MNHLMGIGIGGRGCQAIALVKKQLQADGPWIGLGHTEVSTPSNGGRNGIESIPVRLRAIDLDHAELASLGLDHAEEVQVHPTPLQEVLEHLKSLELGQRSVYPEIETWFPRRDAERIEIPESMWHLIRGACQTRAFGRMGFLLDAQADDGIRSRLSKAISQLAEDPAGEGNLTVCVTASVAGGVGAGMLNDVLVSLHDARRRRAGQLSVRTIVFLILPAGFSTVLDKKRPYERAQANGRAALRELDRLINDHHTVRLEWEKGRTIHLEAPVADHVYLIDGSRDTGYAQHEGHHKLDDAYSAPIATAIYTHLLSGSGTKLASQYTNLTNEYTDSKRRNRYSTFGMYSVEYAWQSLERSLAHRASRTLLEALLAPAQIDPAISARTWLSGDRTYASTDDGHVPPPQLLGDVLKGRETSARGGVVEPTPSWLTPVKDAGNYPVQPTFKNEFPDIGRFRTPYISSDLKKETAKIIENFFRKDEATRLDGFPPNGFTPTVNHNKETMKKQFERSILVETAALMEKERIGCISTGQRFLDEVCRNLERISRSLEEIPKSDIRGCEEELEAVTKKMDESGALHAAHCQLSYLDAQQRLLRAKVREAWRAGAVGLVSDVREITVNVRDQVTRWKERINNLRNAAQSMEDQENGVRTASNGSPLRRVVPLPGSSVDHVLYEKMAGSALAGSLPVHLSEKLTRLRWHVDENADGSPRLSLIGSPEESVAGERPSQVKDHDERPTLPDVARLVAPLFVELRQLSVFDILAISGEQARDIADELIKGAAPLAAHSNKRQLQTADGETEVQKQRFVFADWPTSEVAGTKLGNEVNQLLADDKVQTSELAVNPPMRDRLLAFSADHFVALDAFRGVTLLDEAYRSQRLDIPSPHVFPEERAAARLEAQSEELFRRGFIGKPLDFIPGSHVGLCRHLVPLRHVAIAAAVGLLAWEWKNQLDDEAFGRCYLLRELDGEVFEIGTGRSFEDLLRQLFEDSGRRMKDARDEVKKVAEKVLKAEDTVRSLRNFAQDGWVGPNKCDDTTNKIMMVVAGHCACWLETGSWDL